MNAYGLIGQKLGHSFSPGYFAAKFEREGIQATYGLFEMPSIAGLKPLLEARPDIRGLNVTIPYKQEVLPLLDTLTDEARAVGAVNTILRTSAGLTGYNTDIYGFDTALREARAGEPPLHRAVVLGTGGAARAVVYVLTAWMGAQVIQVSREAGAGHITYERLHDLDPASYQLIVNTTPLGMYPHTDAAPDVPYHLLGPAHLAFDLIYNPETTRFMQLAAQAGARTCNGYRMLVLQAEKAWKIWSQPH